jgi:glucose-1-phosphate thymidylyltransferase
VAEFLVEQMVRAGCTRIFFVLRPGKWDIPAYFGDGAVFGTNIGYPLMNEPYGPPFTLGQAVPFVADADVVVGFPDILLHPPDSAGGCCRQATRYACCRSGAGHLAAGVFPGAWNGR